MRTRPTMREVSHRCHLGTAGAAVVELALVMPFLLSLLVGGLDFAYLFNTSQAVAAATRAGAEYAHNSTTCQSGIDVLNTPQITTNCINGIQNAMQSSYPFTTVLTFPSGVTLACYCDGDGGIIICGNTSCVTAIRGNTEVSIKVTAREAFTPVVSLPGFPTTLNGVTEFRLY